MGDTPTPRYFYIHDDLIEDVRERHGGDSPVFALAQELMAMVRRDDRVSVLTLQEQIAALIARGPHSSFALTIGIGFAGERVARQVHAQAGWFPTIRRVDLTREEDALGGYAVVSPTGVSLAGQLAAVEMATPMAIVDDTIFSGINMRQGLRGLFPPSL